ncbi:MAG TPA: hypothetical protein VK021_02310 [Flavobacteriaceae bacterium]|nr:hypothetical protein [Flavobacteriaceae bacterium]
MNAIQTINTEYLSPSRTIETILVSKNNLNKVFFVYNYEGNSFRVFENHLGLINFFQDKAVSDFHFETDGQLDDFLAAVNISA